MIDNGFHEENIRFFSHFGISEESGIPSKTIALVLQDEYKDNQNAQQIFSLCCNLLSRLFLNIDLFIPSGTILSNNKSNKLLCDYAINSIKLIYPKGNFKCHSEASDLSIYDGVLIVGTKTDGAAISIISNGWNIYINKRNIISDNFNPISACAAACFGVAELFKYVIKPQGSSPNGEMSFSLLNYNLDIPEVNPSLPTEIDIGEVTLVGVGAIGSGAIYLLECLNNVKGKLDLVDNDRYSRTNLNRYIITDESVIGLNKIDVAEHILRKHSKLQIQKYPEVYDDFIKRKHRIDTLISSVDKKIVRFRMQSDIPRLIIDAATTESAIDLARIDFGSGGACLGCLYLPESKDNYLYQLISERTGLSVERVKFLYERSEGVSPEDIDIISGHFKKDLSSWVGSPIESLYAHEYCGSGKISSNVNSNEMVLAPISFISALAGIFIISEIIKDRYFSDFKVKNHFYIDTLKLPNPKFHNFKASNTKCPYCNDDVIIEAYREKWTNN